jgi:hypothetical protein
MPFETCYRCREHTPKDKRGGDFQAIGDSPIFPEGMPFVGILCRPCARELGKWLRKDQPA